MKLMNEKTSSSKRTKQGFGFIFVAVWFAVFFAIASVYAYFTASSIKEGNMAFANLSLSITDTNGNFSTSTDTLNIDSVSPGDTLTFENMKVTNNGNTSAYVMVEMIVKIVGSGVSRTFDNWYTLSGIKVNSSKLEDNSCGATLLASGGSATADYRFKLNGDEFDIRFASAKATVTFKAVAIQSYLPESTIADTARYALQKLISDNKTITSTYTRLDYIEATNAQYIDTGYIPNENTKIDVSFAVNSSTAQADCPLFGARYNSSSNSYTFWCHGEGYTASSYSQLIFNSSYNNFSHFSLNTEHRVTLENGRYSIDGTYTTFNRTGSGSPANTNLVICGLNNGGTSIDSRKFYGRVYSFKIYENNELVRDFVPALNEVTGKAGMYDVKNEKFYASASTTDFLYSTGNLNQVGSVADTVDYSTGTITRNVGVQVFTGSESWVLYSNTSEGISFCITNNNYALGYQTSIANTQYTNIDGAWGSGYKSGRYYIYSDHRTYHNKYFRAPNSSITTVAQWKAWLTEQFNAGTPLTVWYQLATPTTETIR